MATCAKSVQSMPVLSLSPSTRSRSSKFPFQFSPSPPPSSSPAFSLRTTPPTTSFSGMGMDLSVGRSRLVSAAASATDVGPSSGELLADVQIFTAAGQPVRFKDLWEQNEGIAVVALLRHFGCILA